MRHNCWPIQSYQLPNLSAEECDHPVVLFDYQPGRSQEHPQPMLAGYADDRWLRCLANADGPTYFGCLAHARRMFMDAMKGQKKIGGRPAQALQYFKALYQVETLAKAQVPAGQARAAYRHRLRQQHSVPLLDAFKVWLVRKPARWSTALC